MGLSEKLRRLFTWPRRQAAAPSSPAALPSPPPATLPSPAPSTVRAPAPELPAAVSATTPPALNPTSTPSSASAAPPSPPPAALPSPAPASVPSSTSIQPLFPRMRLVEKPSSSKPSLPLPVHVSLSSDLRLVDVKRAASAPTSLDDFRHADRKFALSRLEDVSSPDAQSAQSLELATKPRVRAEEHKGAPAVRFEVEPKKEILLIADSPEERDVFLMSLRLRVAPWPILRAHMMKEMADTAQPSSPLLGAMREVLACDTGVPTAEKNMKTCDKVRKAGEMVGTIAEPSMLVGTFAQGIAGAAETAEDLARLLGGMAIVGSVFTIVALSAKVIRLLALEKDGEKKLADAAGDLREASLSLVGWLFDILRSRFQDKDDLVKKVFDILEDCWRAGNELEQYLLQGRARRVWTADDVSRLVSKTDAVKNRLLAAGLFKNFAGLQKEVAVSKRQTEERLSILENGRRGDDSFSPHFPDPAFLNTNLVRDAAVQLEGLKEEVCRSFKASSAQELSASTRRVALTSVDGEGGIGKTSTCKLLCADADVQKHFEKGAIIWIEVGKEASVDVVKENLAMAVKECGGDRSAKEIRESKSPGIKAAVKSARLYFEERRILLVLDNVWRPSRSNTDVRSWAAELMQIASFQGSVVIMTTRFKDLAESPGFTRVPVGPYDLETVESPDWHLAETLYDTLLKDSAGDPPNPVYVSCRREALKLSCGIPLCIATIVGVVRTLRNNRHNLHQVLSRIKLRSNSLNVARKEVGKDGEISTGHCGIFAATEEILNHLDEQKGQRFKSKRLSLRRDGDGGDCRLWNAAYDDYRGKELSSRYAALHMLPESSPTASLPVLFKLWQVTAEEADEIASIFVDSHIARWEGAGERKSLVLHDVQYQFCSLFGGMSPAILGSTCFGDGVAVNGHALFLSACEFLLPSGKVGDKTSLWGQFCFSQSMPSRADPAERGLREYLAENLIRHLCSAAPEHLKDSAGNRDIRAASRREIVLVLRSFCWLRGRFISQGGPNAVLRDIIRALAAGILGEPETRSLEILQTTVMRARNCASCHSDGTLASSLVQAAQSVEGEIAAPGSVSDTAAAFFQQLSLEAGKDALGAWLKPVSGCHLPVEQKGLQTAVINRIGVRFVSPLGDGKHVVSLCFGGIVRVHDIAYMDTHLVSKDDRKIEFVAAVRQREANECPIIFWVDEDGAVGWSRISFDATGKADEVMVESGSVGNLGNTRRTSLPSSAEQRLLFVSKDGQVVVAALEDGSVNVWERAMENTGNYVLKVGFLIPEVANGDKLEHVVASESGDFVVASTREERLYFWRKGGETAEQIAGPGSFASKRSLGEDHFMFLSNDERNLIYMSYDNPSYDTWDTETRQQSPRVELPNFDWIYCASVAGRSCGGEFQDLLLVGGRDRELGHCVVEYSVGGQLEIVRRWRLSTVPRSVCYADLSHKTGQSSVIVGGRNGRVHLVGAHLSDSETRLEQRESGTRAESVQRSSSLPKLDIVNVVCVMPDAGRVVAGHKDGRLSLWSVEDGAFERVIESERKVDSINCIDISADETVAVTGHGDGTVLVWETKAWKVRCALEKHSKSIVCAAYLANTKRVAAVDGFGQWLFFWDAEKGGAALATIEMGLEGHCRDRAFVNSDARHLVWTGHVKGRQWKAMLFDAVEGRVIREESIEWDEWKEDWNAPCVWADSPLSHIGATASWKQVDGWYKDLCILKEKSGRCWQISRKEDIRVQCALRSAGGQLSDSASVELGSHIYSIVAQWRSDLGEGDRRRAVVACVVDQPAPAILHFITPVT